MIIEEVYTYKRVIIVHISIEQIYVKSELEFILKEMELRMDIYIRLLNR